MIRDTLLWHRHGPITEFPYLRIFSDEFTLNGEIPKRSLHPTHICQYRIFKNIHYGKETKRHHNLQCSVPMKMHCCVKLVVIWRPSPSYWQRWYRLNNCSSSFLKHSSSPERFTTSVPSQAPTVVTKSAYYHLKNIARIRCFVSSRDLEKLVHGFITSRVDYCNGLLPKKTIRQLQLIQNTAARILTRTRTSESSGPYTGFSYI